MTSIPWFLLSILLLSTLLLAKPELEIEGIEDLYQCSNNESNYESKLLRINETMDKNFTVLLHPNMTMFENATTNFLESLQCYFNNITFSYVSFFDDTSESSICDTLNELSKREAKAIYPLLVVFPRNESESKNQSAPPCHPFDTDAMLIQSFISNESVHLFLRSSVADYVMKSYPCDVALFDAIAAIMNPFIHTTDFQFPYQPLPPSKQVLAIEEVPWHMAALVVIIVIFILMLVLPGAISYWGVKSNQRARDQDRQIRASMLKTIKEVMKDGQIVAK